MSEEVVAPVVVEAPKSDVVTVTSDNLQEFVENKGVIPEKAEEPKAEEPKVEEIEAEPPKKKNSFQERISELTAERKAAEKRAEEAERKYQEAEAKLKPVEVKDPTAEPKAEDFKDAIEYAKALSAWSVQDALSKRDAKEAETKARAEIDSRVNTFKARQISFKAETPDYSEKIEAATVQVPDYIRDTVIESDLGPQLLYWFAENQEEADKIVKMEPKAALRAIGRIEAKLGGAEKPAAKSESESKKPELSKAPAPIAPLKGANAPVETDGENLSYEDYKKKREAGKIH